LKKVYLDTHPKRTQIVNALIKGEMSQTQIAKKYGIAKATLNKYMKEHLAERAAKAAVERNLNNGEEILKEIGRAMEKAQKMLDACDEYLTDPKDPKKYYLGPRADEVEIIYEYTVQSGDKEYTKKERDTLKNMLDRLKGKDVVGVKYKYSDPRDLLLKAAHALYKPLELMARIQGEIKEQVQVNIYNNPQFVQLQQIVLKATEKHPEVRDSIIEELNKIPKGDG
jgi:predicted transcriptional regulator